MIVIYFLIAAASVVAFCCGKCAAGVNRDWSETDGEYFAPCILWAIVWPLGWTIYAPYLFSIYIIREYQKRKRQDRRED